MTGCKKAEIKTYIAPKDTPEEVKPVNSELETGLPTVTWKLPTDWKELGADEMNAARFTLPGEASVMITPLALMAGQEPSLVNMWRQMTGQPLLADEEAAKALVPVTVAGGTGQMFEITGTREGGDFTVVTAFQHRDNRSWFFKLQGPPAGVSAARPAFLEFLKTLSFEGAAARATPPTPPGTPAPPAPPAPSAIPGTPPAAWTAQTPGAMQALKFTVPEKDGATAEVTVSVFPSDTGGNLANVRRWRGQMKLPEADDATVLASIKPLPGGPADSVIVELENEGRSLTGAIVPRSGTWYFYKLLGGTAAVTAAREDFITYCKAGS
jgi:hypothetical protein